ncbi:protein-(glutamine-N5) methyltransferase, release factor-specific [Fusobacterium gonidiaformans 3-1-5R]|uniref:Release factor glutamine methyltransferase n=1 Tax=Fusobacterium gonidiaformans 3-1-5R TaxID=469605 RepID=E5BGK4_9FUSO|nr:peptide chain release factor N(5)-glutamine methyltransferase [Fusobacterium gonidiaformans]EFS21627.1 protein-(glutamine-N5) methyltransferase, release factor-specific [Fusobacterium gonidiaformans 3-1-5R]
MNLLDILQFAEEYLKKYSFSKSRLESELLIADVLHLDRLSLYVNYDRMLEEEEKLKIKKYLFQMAKTKKSYRELREEREEENFQEENRKLLQQSIEYLKKYEVPNAKLDAEYIFADVLKVNRNMLSLYLHREISEEQKQELREKLIQRGKFRKPLQYILVKWEFYGYEFITDERALIPRADTEILVEQAKILSLEKENPKILDIGTGTGAIAITLAKEVPEAEVLGIDISERALSLAKENKEYQFVRNVSFLQSNLFEKLEGKSFDIIVSNPPYIPQEEYEDLMPEVKNYEPKNALTDAGDGYSFYQRIIQEANDYLNEKGYLLFEVGYQQAKQVKQWMEEEKFEDLYIAEDYAGHQRVVLGRKGGEN